MNPQEVFEVWKARKAHGDVGREFMDRVMAAIRRQGTTRVGEGLAPLRKIAARPWAKAAALILGTLVGLARIIATVHLILFA
jgi:hypothetical protein